MKQHHLNIKALPEQDKPREKALKIGIRSLTDAELIAILLRTGNNEISAIGLAQNILRTFGGSLEKLAKTTIQDLLKVKGIGVAKAVEIHAMLELGRRRNSEIEEIINVIKSSKDAFEIIKPHLQDLPIEEFWVILLNRSNKVIAKRKLSEGGVHATIVDTKILMKFALEHTASSMVVAHNHPSGSLTPSQENKVLTQKIKDAAKLLDIQLLDHLIIANKSYFSFGDEGII